MTKISIKMIFVCLKKSTVDLNITILCQPHKFFINHLIVVLLDQVSLHTANDYQQLKIESKPESLM